MTVSTGLLEVRKERARLRDWADRLLGCSLAAAAKALDRGERLPELVLSDYQRLELAAYLRRLAVNPKALAAIVSPERGRGRPASPEITARDWWIALDYRLTYKRLRKSDAAVAEVATAWSIPRSATVYEALTECKALRGWWTWRAYVQHMFKHQHPDLKGEALLEALSKSVRLNRRN